MEAAVAMVTIYICLNQRIVSPEMLCVGANAT